MTRMDLDALLRPPVKRHVEAKAITNVHTLEDDAKRRTLYRQFDALRDEVNRFLDSYHGRRKQEKSVLVREAHKIPQRRSLRNFFGALWWLGASRTDTVTRVKRKTVTEEVARTKGDGVDELHGIVDAYIATYREYADHIEDICKDQLRPAFVEAGELKEKYYRETIEAKDGAKENVTTRAGLLKEFERKKQAYATADQNAQTAVDLELELDRVHLELARATTHAVVYTGEAQCKRSHATMLKHVEYGLYMVLQTAQTSAAMVHEFVSQLEHMRTFSVVTSKTIGQLIELDTKIRDGKPYLMQSNDLLMRLVGLAFGRYEQSSDQVASDPKCVLSGIAQVRDRSQTHYQQTVQLLESLQEPQPYQYDIENV